MPRLVVAVGIAILVTLFAVLNTGDVKVNWIFWTSQSPLIVVIVVSVVVGIVLGRIFTIVRRRTRRARR
jgi:lipopolysaccharide assembly protein A